MNFNRKTKVFLSVLLALVLLLSTVSIGILSTSAAGTAKITYSYLYNNAGYAEGRVTLTGSASDYGTYWFYWADGTKALEGFAPITKFNLDRESKSFYFDEFTVIPAGATKLIAIKSTAEPANPTVASAAAVYSIPASKQFKYKETEKEYDFAALSDIHIHKQNPPYYKYSELHLSQALEAAADRDLDFITVCGDMINGYSGLYAAEWAAYQKIIADSSYCNPIYETIGNHETKSDGNKADDVPYTTGINTYKTATGLNVQTEKMQNESYYEITAPNGDHFIFMVLELDSSPNESNEFTEAQMNWLEGLLKKYKNDGHNIFIYEHALIESYGAGDDKVLPLYDGGLKQSYPTVQRLVKLLEENPDVHFLSGHTHLDFEYGYNIDNRGGDTCYTVHIPSLSCPTQIVGGSMDYTMYEDKSQGYFVDVYKDAVVYNGTDLCTNEYLPLYCYMIDQSGQALSKNNIGEEEPDGTMANINVDVSNLSENPEYVYCYAFNEDDGSAVKYPGVLMEKQSDGTYSCEISADYKEMYFFFQDPTLGRIGSDIYPVNNCKIVIGYDLITYSNPNNWSVVNAYVWDDSSTPFSWPGLAMTKGSDGKWSVRIPGGGAFTWVIFNNKPGSAQTDDLNITPYVTVGEAGSYTITEPIVRPTLPIEPTTSPIITAPDTTPTTAPIVTETQTGPTTSEKTEPTTQETTAPIVTEPVNYLYGDANLDNIVNVKDATLIQKYVAKSADLSEKALIQANVTGDSAVNVRDATAIQKKAANMINSFPIEEKSAVVPLGATSSQLSPLISTVKSTLSSEYKYASYDAYMALKKQYYAYKDKAISSMSAAEITSAYNSINASLKDYNTMKENNGGSSTPTGGDVTVYFTNNHNWSTVNAYIWKDGGSTLKAWPGTAMTYVKTNSQNQAVYSITYNSSLYDMVIFNNGGSAQTVDIKLTGVSGTGYYISGGSGKSLTCSTYTFG